MKIKKNTLALFCLYSLQFYLFISYLFINIKNIGGEGVALSYIIAFYITSIIICAMIALKKSLVVNRSFFLFSIIILWITVKILGDTGNYERLKQLIFATTGGVLFFYFCGLFLSISFLDLINRCMKHDRNLVFFVFFLICILFIIYKNIDLFFYFHRQLRNDIFLIQNDNSGYQRPGNFLSISFLITSYIFFYLQSKKVDFHVNSFFYFIIYSIYIGIMILAALSAQMMGSNNAFVVIIGSGLISLVSVSIVSTMSMKYIYHYSETKPLTKATIKILIYKTITVFFFFLLLLLILVFIFDFEINSLRFLGFGSKESSSLSSRLLIIDNNFIIHFQDSPFIGNFNIDIETTGTGTYVHSFFLYSLTHTGIIGFITLITLFYVLFIRLGFKNCSLFYKNKVACADEKTIKLFAFFMLVFLLFIANIATTITWAVLWFGLGIFGHIIIFKKLDRGLI